LSVFLPFGFWMEAFLDIPLKSLTILIYNQMAVTGRDH
jgi:hypothetical protein